MPKLDIEFSQRLAVQKNKCSLCRSLPGYEELRRHVDFTQPSDTSLQLKEGRNTLKDSHVRESNFLWQLEQSDGYRTLRLGEHTRMNSSLECSLRVSTVLVTRNIVLMTSTAE
jgi:hypothetical protein